MQLAGLQRTAGRAWLLFLAIGQVQCKPQCRDVTNTTADTNDLKTWWHNTGEINTETPVQPGNVRQSHAYSIQVATSAQPSTFYDSFVYETIPRNGNGNICIPGDLSSVCNVNDQISIEPYVGVDMAWTQYLTTTDTIVEIVRSDNGSVDPSNVVIRPTTMQFNTTTESGALQIHVPYSATGYRFSVEFQDNLWVYRNGGPGEDAGYVQDVDPSGEYYVSEYDDSMPIVGVEPINSLLVFVSPFPAADLVPELGSDTYEVPQGLVNESDLMAVQQSILYFGPGVYWCTGSAHANLSSSVTWVYFAPGAYVKGAIEYNSQAPLLKATGFGVLSGEQYVYQANTAQGYQNVKSDDSSLKMWRGTVADGTKWILNGPTMNSPPFNSMDLYANDLNTLTVEAWDYKQVGAFFGQTDGIENYPGSYVHDIFYHAGDDTIKTYYSDVLIERVTVWKTNNAPILQFGWYPRTISNITVTDVDVIHTRYNGQTTEYPRALVGSAASYLNTESTSDADITQRVSDFTVANWRCEGLCPGIIGVNPLENIDTMTLSNIWIEQLAADTTGVDRSTFAVYTDANANNQTIALGDDSPQNLGLVIQDFYVGDEHISFAANNWDGQSTGRLAIDSHWDGRWVVE